MINNLYKFVLLYIRYIIGRCKIEKKYKTLRNPYFIILFITLSVIPVKTGIYLSYYFLIFFSSLCHCELSKKVRQSHYSLASFIFFCHCEPGFIRTRQSHPLYIPIFPPFFTTKTINKL